MRVGARGCDRHHAYGGAGPDGYRGRGPAHAYARDARWASAQWTPDLSAALPAAGAVRPQPRQLADDHGPDEALARRLDGGNGVVRPGLQSAQTGASACGTARSLRTPAQRSRPQG